MTTPIAILLGALTGFLGFLPLFLALRLSRRMTQGGNMEMALCGLAGTFVSLILVIVALIACKLLAAEIVLPFGIAEIVTLIASTSLYVLYKNVLSKRKQK